MDNIIDRVIDELVRRLTSPRRAARLATAQAGPSEPAQGPPSPQPPLGASQPMQPPLTVSQPSPQPPLGAPAQQPPLAASQPAISHDPYVEARMAREQLQGIVAEAREQLNAAALVVAEMRESADGFYLRISTMGQRLNDLDRAIEASTTSWAPQPAAPWAAAPPPPPPAPPPPAPPAAGFAQPPAADPLMAAPAAAPAPEAAAVPAAGQYAYTMPEYEAPITTQTISLTVSSLSNLTVVSVVEAALLRIPGVREVALRQLQGREAVLEVRLDEGTGLISGLRKSLPIAFDVTESSDQSLSISLSYSAAQPQAANGGTTGTPLT